MPAALDRQLTSAYRGLLEERFGLRLSDQQSEQLNEVVPQLLAMTRYAGPNELVQAFASGWRADLLQALATSVTVGETHFFRVPAQIRALEQMILPDLIARHAADKRVRIWSAGCSTGEEPYTLAILIRQQLPAPEAWDLDILATDISQPALEAARRATYGEWSFRDTPDEVRRRYFSLEGKRWRLRDEVVRMVRFAPLNLTADAFPSPGPDGPILDLLVCRNVTIYFSPGAISRLYARFAEALARGGWLLLGPSDPVPEDAHLLTSVYVPGAVLWRRADARPHSTRPRGSQTPGDHRVAARPTFQKGRTENGQNPLAGPRQRSRLTAPQPSAVPQQGPPARPARLTRAEAEQLVRDRPLDGGAHTSVGMLDLEDGAVERAIESLRRATFLSPEDGLAQFSLGRAYAKLGQQARARTALTHARRILASMPDEQAIPGGGGIWAGELRQAVEAELTSVGRAARD